MVTVSASSRRSAADSPGVTSSSASADGAGIGVGHVPNNGRRFVAASPDPFTRGIILFTVLIMAALVFGGSVQTLVSVVAGEGTGILRGLAFSALGLAVIALLAARFPVAYVLQDDPSYGTLLVIERRRFKPVRLVLARYETAEPVRRVVFPWVPLLSGSRLFGLRGARIEEAIAGFWSFGCDGRRAIILAGGGRPRTLISPVDPRGLLEELRSSPDTAALVADDDEDLDAVDVDESGEAE
jgi:hypothetical protein